MGAKVCLAAVAVVCSVFGQEWDLERLYTRPYVWGTPAQSLTWSEEEHTLVFRWNAEGGSFYDLYAYHPDESRLVRLTDFEPFADKLLLNEAETDERRSLYLPPKPGIREFDLSRDGRTVAFTYRGELFTVPTDGSAEPFRLTRSKSGESSPELSPDARRIAAARGGQIVVQDLDNGQLWQVTDIQEPESLSGYSWSPNGERFVYAVDKGTPRQVPLPNYSGRFVTAPTFPRDVAGDEPVASAMYLIDERGGEPVAIELGEWNGASYVSAPVWSKDSTKLAVLLVHPTMKQEQILVVDAASGESHSVWEETDERWIYTSEFGFSPDGEQVWFVSEADGWAHLYRIPSEGGEAVQVTRGDFETRPEQIMGFQGGAGQPPQWIGDYIYYPSTEDGTAERHFYRIRPDGTDKEKLSSREGINLGVVSGDGLHIAWNLTDLENPSDLWVDEERVTTRVLPEFADYPWPETRFVSFPSRGDGKTVSAKLLLPPGYDPAVESEEKWPAVFFIHGAGIATSVLKQWGSYHELRYVFNTYLANHGYVVMDLDYRGSTGYGRDWRSEVYLHMGGKDLDDVLGAVDYLEGLENIDMGRLGIWGVSYGGFMTNMAMFLSPETFLAGSSWASVNDWENYNAGYTRERLNTPAESPEAFRRSSPITFSGNLENHLLIVHGMVDNNVLFQDAVQLAEKLIQEGKLFGQIYYPQESHGFVRDETWIDACRRTTEWFDRYLMR